MRTLQQTYSGTWPIQVVGKLFRIISAESDVDVRFFRNGIPVAESLAVGVGFWMRPGLGFDRVDVITAPSQTVKVGISDGDGGYDAMTIVGDVKSTIKQAETVTQLAPVAVGVAAAQLCALDLLRRELRIWNDGPADVFVGGPDVTAAGGAVRIAPGGMWIEATAAVAELWAVSLAAGNTVRLQELR